TFISIHFAKRIQPVFGSREIGRITLNYNIVKPSQFTRFSVQR
ncbi:hypothetical protein D046_1720B, partial [Vibrio parahaemolyticus V-223/04]